MVTICRRKSALDTPLSVLLMDSLLLQSKQLCLIEAGGAALSSADGGVGVAPTARSPGSSLTPASTGAILVLREKMNAPDDVGESKVSSELGGWYHAGIFQ